MCCSPLPVASSIADFVGFVYFVVGFVASVFVRLVVGFVSAAVDYFLVDFVVSVGFGFGFDSDFVF